MPRIKCPKCAMRFVIGAEAFGHLTDCRFCLARFPAIREFSTYEAEADELPPLLGMYGVTTERGPHSDRGGGARSHLEFQNAFSRIRRPANALAFVSTIVLLLCLIGGFALIAAGFNLYANARPQRTGLIYSPFFNQDKRDGVILIVDGISSALFGTLYHLFILIGAIKVKRLRGTGWGYTAAIMGIGTVFLWACGLWLVRTPWFGALCFLGMVTVGIAVWLIVVMNNADVMRTIRVDRLKNS